MVSPRITPKPALRSSRKSVDSAPLTTRLAPTAPKCAAPSVRSEPSVIAPEPAAPAAPTESVLERLDERSMLQQYINEVRRTPLLTIDEEIALAGRIRRGDRAARDHMIKANLLLVVKIAHDYREMGLPLLDLISEGNLGLIRAVERFDPAKGGKLSTYAAWWIKQCMKRALANHSKTIRLPVHLVDKIARLRRAVAKLTDELGREPSNEEISEVLRIPVNKIALLKTVSVRPASLDAPVGGADDSASLGELVGDESAVSADEELARKNLLADLRAAIEGLEPREAAIIRKRFGLDGEKECTLEDVGRLFNVTRERIRQLEFLALSKIRRRMHGRDSIRTREEIEEDRDPSDRASEMRTLLAQSGAVVVSRPRTVGRPRRVSQAA